MFYLTQRDTDYHDTADSILLSKKWLAGEVCNATLQRSKFTPKTGKTSEIGAREIAKFLSKNGKTIAHNQVATYLRIEEQAIPELKNLLGNKQVNKNLT